MFSRFVLFFFPPSFSLKQTYFTDFIRKAPVASLDPSMALGFYFRTAADFDDFVVRFKKGEDGMSELFCVLGDTSSTSSAAAADATSTADGFEIVRF